MSWLVATGAFVYDFLADDGWELLVGLLILLPLTYLLASWSQLAGGVVMVAGVLLTVSISLARKVPKVRYLTTEQKQLVAKIKPLLHS